MAKTDDTMLPIPRNDQSTPDDAEISCRVALWNSQKTELAAHISPSTDYTRLIWNIQFRIGDPGVNERLMYAKECQTALELIGRLHDNPMRDDFHRHIKATPFMVLPPVERTDRLRRNLWVMTRAETWVSSYDAPSHNSVLWQFALLRASCNLHTGSFTPAQQR
jgi:hypothetical protein